MTRRILPREEYWPLDGTELEMVWPHLPESARVLVVEDDAGAIVGCWAAFEQTHVEGVWVAPVYRGKGSVARALLSGMRWLTKGQTVATAALTDDVRDLLIGLGATKLPGDHYVLTLE